MVDAGRDSCVAAGLERVAERLLKACLSRRPRRPSMVAKLPLTLMFAFKTG